MSDLENICPQQVKISLFGQEYPLQFNFRTYKAIQQRFGKSPLELIAGMRLCDVDTLIACLWGGTLVFDEFDPADPARIKQEVGLDKLYSVNFYEVMDAVRMAMLSSQPVTDEEIAEQEKKKPIKVPQVERASMRKDTGAGRSIWRRIFCR